MTRFRFRAWCPYRKCWDVSVSAIELNADGEIVAKNDMIVMQSTGLRDKNGKEIFEGDIYESYVKMRHKTTGKVQESRSVDLVTWGTYTDDEYGWNTRCFLLGTSPLSADVVKDAYSNPYWDAIEEHSGVIGNIYENPDFLPKAA